MTPTLLLVRHGETAYNTSPERLRGWQDVPLTPEGRQAAKQLAKLCAILKIPLEVIYTSDLQRAKDTAETIGKACGARVVPLKALRPWDLGKLAGEPAKAHRRDLMSFVEQPEKPLEGGESFASFKDRFLTALERITRYAISRRATVMLVTHTRDIRAALEWASHSDKPASFFTQEKDPVTPGHMVKLTWEGKRWKIGSVA